MGYNAIVIIVALFVGFMVMDFIDELAKYKKSRDEDTDSLKKSLYKLLIALVTLIITVIKEVF